MRLIRYQIPDGVIVCGIDFVIPARPNGIVLIRRLQYVRNSFERLHRMCVFAYLSH